MLKIRKHYIDNLRNITILLLFPVHTFMIWNDFGSGCIIWEISAGSALKKIWRFI